jgi:hypothetical protein
MERETVSGSGTADASDAARERDPDSVPNWWATYSREFPRWYVWRGVAGHYYGRVRRTSPPMVVRALNADGLRDEIMHAELSGWPVSSRSRLNNHCALAQVSPDDRQPTTTGYRRP